MTFLSSAAARGEGRTSAGWRSRCSSRSASACTTSAKGSRSARSFAVRRAAARDVPDRRLHDPQRHRRTRDRRAGRRGRRDGRASAASLRSRSSPARPAILGAWIGGYVTSDVLGVLFFALAAGAALQVVVEVGRFVARRAPGGLTLGLRRRRLPRRHRGDVRDRPARRLAPSASCVRKPAAAKRSPRGIFPIRASGSGACADWRSPSGAGSPRRDRPAGSCARCRSDHGERAPARAGSRGSRRRHAPARARIETGSRSTPPTRAGRGRSPRAGASRSPFRSRRHSCPQGAASSSTRPLSRRSP